jgi:hypothetical protein
MAHASSARSVASGAFGARPEVRGLLFKSDHPRAIDRYIDYFGGVIEAAAEGEDGTCGDELMEQLA